MVRIQEGQDIVQAETSPALLGSIADMMGVFDWSIATNRQSIDLAGIIDTHGQLWDMETGFSKQDDAPIRSKDAGIRLFLFAYQRELPPYCHCCTGRR